MQALWKYHVKGTTAEQSWETSGEVLAEQQDVWQQVMIQSFQKLTSGKAVYGRPGVGCRGPYSILSVNVEKIDGHEI